MSRNPNRASISKGACFKLMILLVTFTQSELTDAGALQATASIESSRYLGGANLTDDSPAVSLAIDWTFDKGSFAGMDCYASSANINRGLDSGCDVYAGFFKPLSNSKALSAQITRHQYSRGFGQRWDFNDLAVNWHTSKRTRLSTIYAKNWLNLPFDTIAIQGETQITLSDKVNLNLIGNLMAIESGAPVRSLASAKAALTYTHSRWTTEAGLIYTDKDQVKMIPFDVDKPELLLTVSYRLY